MIERRRPLRRLFLHSCKETDIRHYSNIRIVPIFILFVLIPIVRADNPAVTIVVDPTEDVHPINPLIYGMSFASEQIIDELNITINRSGGNSQTRYNWQADATNRAMDWYFESLPNSNPDPSQLPNGSTTDRFYESNVTYDSETILTVPMIGYVAKDRNRLCSFSIIKYGPQQDNDWQWFPDAGNGIRLNGTRITENDPLDAHIEVNEIFMGDWIDHLVGRFGTAAYDGVGFYALDNEPGLWFETHRDVVHDAPHDWQLADTSIVYALTIKASDPSTNILGYEGWGWLSLIYSPYDFKWAGENGNWSSTPDRTAGGYEFFAEYYLQRAAQAEIDFGTRFLDVFTSHLYPQGGEYSNNESPDMQARRMRSTRSLWDSTYVDETWIADIIMLIPRMKAWVDTYYPGTMIGITEYNWGSLGYPDGGIAQADILGIFGREGLDIGTLWTTVDPDTPAYNAFKIYTNYDDNDGHFGDLSVQCTVPNPDEVSAFASIDSETSELKLIVLNKYPSDVTPITINVFNSVPLDTVQVFQWAGTGDLQQLPDIITDENSLSFSAPAYSATLFVSSLCVDYILDGPGE